MKISMMKSAIYLIIISTIAKGLSFFVRILLARNLSQEAMNLYSLGIPSMVIMITLVQMGIPAALSKVLASKESKKDSVKVSIILSFCNNILTTLAFLLFIPILSERIYHNQNTLPVLYAILPLLPLVTISGICKGYLLGIQKHISASSAQIFEEGSRIIFLLLILNFYTFNTPQDIASVAMLSISVGEIFSIMAMLYHIDFNFIGKKSFFPLTHGLSRYSFSQILEISIPMTGSRFIGSFTYFLEPIIMVIGINAIYSSVMIESYGILNGYVLPIITMPSFLTVTLSNMLLPSFTYDYTHKNYQRAKKNCFLILICCFTVGLCCSIICYFYPDKLLMFFYKNTKGASTLKLLAWPFCLYALQPPFSSILHALSKSKYAMLDTFSGSILRLLIVFFATPVWKENTLCIALVVSMLTTTFFHFINIILALINHNHQ